MHGMDMVPNPQICIAALKACRRINDFALAVRFLEALKVTFISFLQLVDNIRGSISSSSEIIFSGSFVWTFVGED